MLTLKEVTDELHPVFPRERATTMLLVLYPRTFVYGAVAEVEDTFSMLHVVLEVASVGAVIWPCHLSCAFSLAIHPVASVSYTVRPCVRACLLIGINSFTDIVSPVAIVLRFILPLHTAFSVSLVILKFAFVKAAI